MALARAAGKKVVCVKHTLLGGGFVSAQISRDGSAKMKRKPGSVARWKELVVYSYAVVFAAVAGKGCTVSHSLLSLTPPSPPLPK